MQGEDQRMEQTSGSTRDCARVIGQIYKTKRNNRVERNLCSSSVVLEGIRLLRKVDNFLHEDIELNVGYFRTIVVL